MTTEAQNLVPSLRTRQPSASYLPSLAAVCKRARGNARGPIFLGVEAAEVLADDFVWRCSP